MNESWTEVTLYSESLTGDEILALIYDLPFDSFDYEKDLRLGRPLIVYIIYLNIYICLNYMLYLFYK